MNTQSALASAMITKLRQLPPGERAAFLNSPEVHAVLAPIFNSLIGDAGRQEPGILAQWEAIKDATAKHKFFRENKDALFQA